MTITGRSRSKTLQCPLLDFGGCSNDCIGIQELIGIFKREPYKALRSGYFSLEAVE